jgi:hypothetical protein
MRAHLGGRVLTDWSAVAVAEPLIRPLVAHATGLTLVAVSDTGPVGVEDVATDPRWHAALDIPGHQAAVVLPEQMNRYTSRARLRR